jgi:hypothetical protein
MAVAVRRSLLEAQMMKSLVALTLLCGSTWACSQAGLTEQESRWLEAAGPVLMHARQEWLLPVDVLVQTQEALPYAPISTGLMNGRCKLVFAMRSNAALDEPMQALAPELFNAVAQAIVAHEVAHCWRMTRGAANSNISYGFISRAKAVNSKGWFSHDLQNIRESRLEEGFADLFGLAWTQQQHPQHYEQVHAWLSIKRESQRTPGGEHDTLAWLRLAKDPIIFKTEGSALDQVMGPWRQGLTDDK